MTSPISYSPRAHARNQAQHMRRVAKAARQQAYWARALRFETFKVGGLRFIKLGNLSMSICMSKPRGEH